MGLNYVDISIAPPIYTETTIIPGKQGIQGIQGISGVYVGENAPTEADGEYNVWIKTNGEEMDFRGNGITNFEYYYGISTQQGVMPTNWQSTPPSNIVDNAFVWTKINIKTTDDLENQTFYVVAKQGTPAGFDDSKCTATIPANDTWAANPTVTVTPVGGDTDKGFQFAFEHLRGKSIKNIRALYAVHNHPKEAPEDSKFSTELPAVVGQDNYLWTKVEVTVDGPNGGTVYAFPFVSKTGDKGEKGDTGAPAGFGTITAEVGSNVDGKPKVTVTADGDNTAKKLHFNFDYLRGATFIPSVSKEGVLSWDCNNTELKPQKPAPLDMVGKIKTAFSGGCTFQVLNAAPPEGTPDTMISLVVDNNANA